MDGNEAQVSVHAFSWMLQAFSEFQSSEIGTSDRFCHCNCCLDPRECPGAFWSFLIAESSLHLVLNANFLMACFPHMCPVNIEYSFTMWFLFFVFVFALAFWKIHMCILYQMVNIWFHSGFPFRKIQLQIHSIPIACVYTYYFILNTNFFLYVCITFLLFISFLSYVLPIQLFTSFVICSNFYFTSEFKIFIFETGQFTLYINLYLSNLISEI